MNKNTLFKKLVLLGLVSAAPLAHAQKSTTVYGKSSTPRTDTVSVSNVPPPPSLPSDTSGTKPSSTIAVPATNTNTTPGSGNTPGTNTGVPATNTTTPGTTIPGTGTDIGTSNTPVQGTSTTPPTLGNTSQVGGVNQAQPNRGGNHGKGRGKRLKAPAPATEADIPVAPVAPVPVAAPVAVPAVSGTQTSATTPVASCEDEALKEVYKIISSDQNNAFAKMFELTVMRLAKKALAEGNVTLEGYTQNKIAELEGYFEKSKEAGEVQNKVKAAYEMYGKPGDLAAINKDLDAAMARGQKACYWSSSTRLQNDHTASYVLAMSVADPDSGLSDADAATIWAVEKIRKGAGVNFENGRAYGNLLNVSTRVARYLGAIQGGTSVTPEQLDAKIAAQEKELNDLIGKARTKAEMGLAACIERQNPSCVECQAKAKASLSAATSSMEQVQRGLALAVQKSENVKMVSGLKGKMGDIDFNLDNFTHGAVKKAPERMSEVDTCGMKKKGVVSAAPISVPVSASVEEIVLTPSNAGSNFDWLEAESSSVNTQYFAPQGEVLSFAKEPLGVDTTFKINPTFQTFNKDALSLSKPIFQKKLERNPAETNPFLKPKSKDPFYFWK